MLPNLSLHVVCLKLTHPNYQNLPCIREPKIAQNTLDAVSGAVYRRSTSLILLTSLSNAAQ